jgi:hypothetical protein
MTTSLENTLNQTMIPMPSEPIASPLPLETFLFANLSSDAFLFCRNKMILNHFKGIEMSSKERWSNKKCALFILILLLERLPEVFILQLRVTLSHQGSQNIRANQVEREVSVKTRRHNE